jgi:ABC-type sugar transport system permease subunit
MKIVAIIFNIVLFGFTCLVLVTDGPPQEAVYVFLSLLSLAVPLFSVLVLWRFLKSTAMKIVAGICNIVLLGFHCWAFLSQYPHPKEEGFVAFAVLMFLTPILTVAALLRSGVRQK